MVNPIIIFGSSRSSGETWKAVQAIVDGKDDIPIIDLSTLQISHFDYEQRNQGDDYLPLMERIIQHDLIVLATPVYWYSMSSQMKIFIDRLTDLLTIRKDIGQNLRGKRLFVISSCGASMHRCFEEPFMKTCEYMGMKYEGCIWIHSGGDSELGKDNVAQINKGRLMVLGDGVSKNHINEKSA